MPPWPDASPEFAPHPGGIRSLSVEEAEFMEEGRVRSHSADFILDGGAWWETICGDLHGDLPRSTDDVLDPP